MKKININTIDFDSFNSSLLDYANNNININYLVMNNDTKELIEYNNPYVVHNFVSKNNEIYMGFPIAIDNSLRLGEVVIL